MKTMTTTTTTIKFDPEDVALTTGLIRDHIGDVKISYIMDNYSLVGSYYLGAMTLLKKLAGWSFCSLTPDEYNVLANVLSKTYNSELTAPDVKARVKDICDAIDLQRRM